MGFDLGNATRSYLPDTIPMELTRVVLFGVSFARYYTSGFDSGRAIRS